MTPWTVTCQAPLSMGFSRQEYWNGLPFPSPGDLPDPGIEPEFPALAGRFFPAETPLGSLQNQMFSHSSGSQKPDIEVSAGPPSLWRLWEKMLTCLFQLPGWPAILSIGDYIALVSASECTSPFPSQICVHTQHSPPLVSLLYL